MVGLIDCNNFFVSCERVFNPALRDRPVVVFSNNDGCAVSMSIEAKALGIKRGDPMFKIADLCESHGVGMLSGNHRLYGDMSSRVMATIASKVEKMEIYSIDEAFLSFEGLPNDGLVEYGREIVRDVRRSTGIPTSLGIAPTKTLAKVASRFAKLYAGYHNCCMIDSEQKRRKALELTAVKEVWGIGRRLSKKLAEYGIASALQLAELDKTTVERLFSMTGEKTWRELNGEPCVDFQPFEPARKQLCCSRSFSKGLTSIDDLSAAIASFAAVVGRKLREKHLCAASMSVFIHTDSFKKYDLQYFNSAHHSLVEPTADTMTLTECASDCLKAIFRKGYSYKKAGVLIAETVDAEHIQQSLFGNNADRERRSRLMSTMDDINHRNGTNDIIHTASYRPIDNYVRREHMSRLFTTRMTDIISINCNHG